MTSVAPGTIFARDFRIIRPLAEGGMGAVYVAEQLSTGRERALKVLLPKVVDDPRNREGFELEARVASRIGSEHVVEVVAAGIDEATNAPWLAMELLRGENLWDHVTRGGPLRRELALTLFDQLGDALSKAHRAGVVHRDLKPENLFVAEPRIKGVPFVLKVLDFGIARLIKSDRTAATSTRAIGSPLWFAPEQTLSGAKLRPATDVWALGLIAFWALTGRSFWRSANAEEFSITALLMEVAVNPIPSASARAAELGVVDALPQGFDAWFARCVARDPDDRYHDAGEAIPALLPLLAPEVSTGARPRTEVLDEGPPGAPTAELSVVPVAPAVQSVAQTVAMPVVPTPQTVAMPVTTTSPHVTRAAQTPAQAPSGWAVPLGLGVATLVAVGVWFTQRPSPGATPPEAGVAESSAADVPPTNAPEARAGEPLVARFSTPSSPDPHGGRFSLSEATAGLGTTGPLFAMISTSLGVFRCMLHEERAPNTVANFVGLARGLRAFWDPVAGEWTRRPFYDGSVFHRVIPGFMIQGGDVLRSGAGGTGYEFADEHVRPHDAPGQLCMANRGPHTNGGQFFITNTARPHLDGSYSIFGDCVDVGLVRRIASVPRDSRDRPYRPVFIEHVTIRRGI